MKRIYALVLTLLLIVTLTTPALAFPRGSRVIATLPEEANIPWRMTVDHRENIYVLTVPDIYLISGGTQTVIANLADALPLLEPYLLVNAESTQTFQPASFIYRNNNLYISGLGYRANHKDITRWWMNEPRRWGTKTRTWHLGWAYNVILRYSLSEQQWHLIEISRAGSIWNQPAMASFRVAAAEARGHFEYGHKSWTIFSDGLLRTYGIDYQQTFYLNPYTNLWPHIDVSHDGTVTVHYHYDRIVHDPDPMFARYFRGFSTRSIVEFKPDGTRTVIWPQNNSFEDELHMFSHNGTRNNLYSGSRWFFEDRNHQHIFRQWDGSFVIPDGRGILWQFFPDIPLAIILAHTYRWNERLDNSRHWFRGLERGRYYNNRYYFMDDQGIFYLNRDGETQTRVVDFPGTKDRIFGTDDWLMLRNGDILVLNTLQKTITRIPARLTNNR